MSLRDEAAHVIGDAVLAERQADEELLTVKQYATVFGLHVQTVYSAIRLNHRLHGRVIRTSARSIRIAVPSDGASGVVRPMRRRPTRGIYFARCGEFIKIGLAVDVDARVRSLQTALPFPLVLLGVVPVPDGQSLREAEREFHDRFEPLRHIGEWFRAEDALVAFCSTCKHRYAESSVA